MSALILYYVHALETTPSIHNGAIDLSNTEFSEDGVIALDGEWEFYWNQFLSPSDLDGEQYAFQYMNVPGNWLRDEAGNTYAPKGYATYRVTISHIPDATYFGLKKANIRNASNIYVNGNLVLEDGQIAKHLEESVAGNHSKVVYFELEESTAEIIVQASNHAYIVGGIAKSITFGTQEALTQQHYLKVLFEFAMILVVVVIGLFYLFIYFANSNYRKREPVTLPLALSCLFFGVMNSIYSERIIAIILPDLTLNSTFRFGHFMSALSIILVWIVVNKVNRVFLPYVLRNILIGFYGIFIVCVLTFPLEIYLNMLTFYMSATVVLFLAVWIRIAVLFIKAHPHASNVEHSTLVVTIFSVFLFWLDMIMYSLGAKTDMLISFLTISVYSIAFAILLIVRYTNSYKNNEKLTIQLIETFSTLDQTTREAQRNELAFLQAQIKPHFLFNALSSIISLCYTNGERAGKLLTDLSGYLKRSFQIDMNTDFVTIENELRLIQAFVDIEKARFGDRIHVSYDIDDDVLPLRIIPLVIEPLVENAIRHGVLTKKSGGEVKLTIKKQDQSIFICVEDNGNGVEAGLLRSILNQEGEKIQAKGNGVSLSNIHARLQNYYDVELQFDTSQQGTKVYVKVPTNHDQEEDTDD